MGQHPCNTNHQGGGEDSSRKLQPPGNAEQAGSHNEAEGEHGKKRSGATTPARPKPEGGRGAPAGNNPRPRTANSSIQQAEKRQGKESNKASKPVKHYPMAGGEGRGNSGR